MKRRLLAKIKSTRKIVADVYEEIMKDIPTIPEDETLDQQVEREMEMESELTPESDMDVVMKALKKKFNIQSNDFSEVLDEAADRVKLKQSPVNDMEKILN